MRSGIQALNLAFDLRTLNVFLAVAEAGGMTAAARELGLTQPAVSQIMTRLETELGAPLIDRGQRPYLTTPAGEAFVNGARRLLADAERLQAAIRDAAGATLPIARIGLIDSFAATVGPPLIRGLRNQARHFSVWSGISPNLSGDLIHRKLDFIVTTDPMENLGGIERHRLLREPFVLVLPKRMARAIKDVRLEDLARNHPFVRYSVRSRIGAQIEEYLRRLGLEVPQSLEFDGSEPVFAMVSGGVAWAITTPLCLIHGRTAGMDLAPLPLPGPSLSRTLYLLCREGEFGALPRRIARDARDILRQIIKREGHATAPWAVKETVIG